MPSSRAFRIGLLYASALLLGASALLGSNMGFLVWRTLPAAGPESLTGTHTLNLPYQRPASLNTAGDLMRDVGFANVRDVERFIESVDGLMVYTGRKGSFDLGPLVFPLTPGECYFIRMNTTTNYLIGGSSDPAVALQLDAPGANSRSGTNFIALPYHATATTASQLLDDIGQPSVASVQRYVTSTNSLQVYTGRKGSGPDFPLATTECYFVRMNTTTSYIPSHW